MWVLLNFDRKVLGLANLYESIDVGRTLELALSDS
jgi:hypothetical protein